MELWEKNIRALTGKNEMISERIRQQILQQQGNGIQIQTLNPGREVITVTRDGYTWYLNSRLDPDGAADLYARRYTVKPFYKYFIFGFGDGRAVRKLLEKCDDSNALIICEPDAGILAKAFLQFDLEDLILDPRVWFCLSEMKEDIYRTVFATVDYTYIDLLEFCILPGYDVLYTAACEKFIDEVIERISYEVAHRNTYICFNRRIPQNMLFHMKHMIGQRNIAQVKKVLEDAGALDLPAVIVAAGPSLDKNIKDLKQAEGQAFIFVVDAALKTAIREGIRPDLVCTVDPKAPERFYETVGDRELLWCGCSWTNANPIRQYGKKVFYYNSIVPWWDEAIEQELGEPFPKIESGGCVSAEAFQVARYLGFRTIIFIGQDLAFTGGQSHTKGIEGVLGDNDAYIKNRRLKQVEDTEGNLLYTDFQMDFYRQWFEKKLEHHGDFLCVIDATEGGAKIKGAQVLTLKEAIRQKCRKQVDVYPMIKDLPPAFDERQRARLYRRMEQWNDWKREFEQELQRGILLEERLREEAHTLDAGQTAKRLKEIARQNYTINHHPMIDWIVMYARKEEADLQKDILAKEDMEIEEMMERSIRLLVSYQEGLPLFEEDLLQAVSR